MENAVRYFQLKHHFPHKNWIYCRNVSNWSSLTLIYCRSCIYYFCLQLHIINPPNGFPSLNPQKYCSSREKTKYFQLDFWRKQHFRNLKGQRRLYRLQKGKFSSAFSIHCLKNKKLLLSIRDKGTVREERVGGLLSCEKARLSAFDWRLKRSRFTPDILHKIPVSSQEKCRFYILKYT